MIYPYNLPEDVKSEAEKKVYNQLSQLKDKYDIFYSRSFIGRKKYEKREYEIDFIVADKPDRRKKCRAIFCLEVKGGTIEYNGEKNSWFQNGLVMDKSPDKQASDASHSLLNRYKDLLKEVPVDWALCFPDCELLNNTPLPPSLSYNRIIDSRSTVFLDDALSRMVEETMSRFNKAGCNQHVYESFKNDILRSVGWVETLSTRFRYEDERFVRLTDTQVDFFSKVSDNKNILVSGFAGTGKTVIAKAAAQEKIIEGKTVLFLCYNRTLASKIRFSFDKNNELIEIANFHSLARRIIDKKDPSWWKSNYSNEDDFWSIEIPLKLHSSLDENLKKYDVIIIDEAQDFKELWFESVFKMKNEGGFRYIFCDPFQDIFNREMVLPDHESFLKFNLDENCRNTKNIVNQLSEIIDQDILSHSNSPLGEDVTVMSFESKKELNSTLKKEVNNLVHKQGIQPEQILLMTNSPINESSIDELWKIGNIDVTNLPRSGRFYKGKIHYASINLFKGLEIDVLFIIDTQLMENIDKIKKFYTQISRGKNKVFIYSLNMNKD